MNRVPSSALALFRIASTQVPAYRDFLKRNKVKPEQVKSYEDFLKLPVTDKKNYIQKYPLREIFPKGEIPPLAYASSGSSGVATFWFRGDKQEKVGGDIHERIFRDIFNIKKEDQTLVIICFSMGVWIAGNFTLAACREVSRRGYHLTTITPGLEKEDIFYALKNLASLFKNVIITGYPPFLMDVAVEASKRGIRFGSNVFAITAGDKFSEEWRDTFLGFLETSDPSRIVSVYGAADAGVLGYETPISIKIRRMALTHQGLYKALFDGETVLPALVQYDPKQIFFESKGSELVFTVNAAAPLIRYNIHDEGKIISLGDVRKMLGETGFMKQISQTLFKEWNLPFIVKKGRSDVAVTFYAINIYPETIKIALDTKNVAGLVTGQFFVYNKDVNNNKTQKLYIQVELADGIRPREKYSVAIQRSIIDTFRKLSIEYRKLYSVIGVRAVPAVNLVAYGSKEFQRKGINGILNIKGKKPRVVI